MTDHQTLSFYAAEAAAYAASTKHSASKDLDQFLTCLPPGARILELGCGSGAATAAMMSAGFDVVATDGSPEMAREAELLIGRPVRVMLFEELIEQVTYDGVWASACLLHVPITDLPFVLHRVWCALRPGGVFYASYKAGEQDGRDQFDRYYNYPSRADLASHYSEAALWAGLEIREQEGTGYDNLPTRWLAVTARRPFS